MIVVPWMPLDARVERPRRGDVDRVLDVEIHPQNTPPSLIAVHSRDDVIGDDLAARRIAPRIARRRSGRPRHEQFGHVLRKTERNVLDLRRKAGENSVATVVPPGSTSARYSPSASSWKLACSSPPGSRRSFPDAKTSR